MNSQLLPLLQLSLLPLSLPDNLLLLQPILEIALPFLKSQANMLAGTIGSSLWHPPSQSIDDLSILSLLLKYIQTLTSSPTSIATNLATSHLDDCHDPSPHAGLSVVPFASSPFLHPVARGSLLKCVTRHAVPLLHILQWLPVSLKAPAKSLMSYSTPLISLTPRTPATPPSLLWT